MQWIDVAMEEPRRSQLKAQGVEEPAGVVWRSDDGSVIVSRQGLDAPEKWVVWDMVGGERPAFGAVTFNSVGAAQRAASAWKESAVTWAAVRAATLCRRAASFVEGIAAGVALRIAGK